MPVLLTKKYNAGNSIGIWDLKESISTLLDILGASNFNDLPRFGLSESMLNSNLLLVRQRLATHLMIRQLRGNANSELRYDAYRKPFLVNSAAGISISHSFDKIAVQLNNDSLNAGIDIEQINIRVERIANRFMRADEFKLVPESAKTLFLTGFWTAKEALYKLYGKKNIAFKEQLIVTEIDCNQPYCNFKGEVRTDSEIIYANLAYERVGDYVVSSVLDSTNIPNIAF